MAFNLRQSAPRTLREPCAPSGERSSWGGTGLGLAIIADVVAAHDGDVTIGDSQLGAEVGVRLLAARAEGSRGIQQ